MSEEAKLDGFVGNTSETDKDSSEELSKHPRLGQMPTEWKIQNIPDIAEVVGGSTPSTKNDEYWGGDIPWATPTDITGLSGNKIWETADMLTEEGLNSASTHLLPPHSVLMTSRATIGECAVNMVEMATNQGFKSLIPKKGIGTWYLYYRMLETVPFLESLGTGSTFDEVSKSTVESVEIPIPPPEEQHKIASVLFNFDLAIRKTEQLIDQSNRVKKGLTQNLLKNGTKNETKSKTDSRFGSLPESWELHSLKDIGEIAGRTAPEKEDSECWGGDIPWATPSEITSLEGLTISETEEYLTEIALEKVPSNLLPPGSVLLTTRATIGKCAVNTVEMTTNQGFKNFIPGDRIDTWYAYYRLTYESDYLASLSKGSTFPEVGKDTVENFVIPVPPLEEQREIGKRLKAMDDMVLSYKEHKSHLQRLKKGLMQDLLSGKVRTTDRNIPVLSEVAEHG